MKHNMIQFGKKDLVDRDTTDWMEVYVFEEPEE